MTRAPMKVIYEPPLRTILVAGGASFAGQALCRLLTSDGALRVISLDRYGDGQLPRETGNFGALDAASADEHLLAALFDEAQIDSVVDLAADACGDLAAVAQAYWAAMPDDQRARCRFVCVTQGDGAERRVTANLPIIRAVTACLYGPGQADDAVIPATILSALAGAPVWVADAGRATYDWLHVDDLAMALLTVLLRGQAGARYAISAREAHSSLTTAAMICDLVDRLAPRPDGRKHRSLIRFQSAQRQGARSGPLDPERIGRELGWHAQIGLRDGLIDAIDWYRRRDAPAYEREAARA